MVKQRYNFLQYLSFAVLPLVICVLTFSCKHKALQNEEMVGLLREASKLDNNADNVFSPDAVIKRCDSLLENSSDKIIVNKALNDKANTLLQLGEEQKAIEIFEALLKNIS